jgi:hypothetical protein
MNAHKSGKEVGIATKLTLPEITYMLDLNEYCETVKKNLKLSSDFLKSRIFSESMRKKNYAISGINQIKLQLKRRLISESKKHRFRCQHAQTIFQNARYSPPGYRCLFQLRWLINRAAERHLPSPNISLNLYQVMNIRFFHDIVDARIHEAPLSSFHIPKQERIRSQDMHS